MILGCPIVNQFDLTLQFINSLANTVEDKENFKLVIIDNGSDEIFQIPDVDLNVSLVRNERNQGYYYPLLDLYNTYPEEELIGLVHNDMIFYEQGWDTRMKESFDGDSKLGLVGLCGSWEADSHGGRGGGTMCFFRGEKGQTQDAGMRIYDLRPAILLDSLFMMFRRSAIPDLKIDENVAPCHFYDKIWSCRMIEAGWKVAVLGSEIDHIGGQTAVLEASYNDAARDWCIAQGIDYFNHKTNLTNEVVVGENPGLAVYLEAERRFLTEYRDTKRLFPCVVDLDWNISPR